MDQFDILTTPGAHKTGWFYTYNWLVTHITGCILHDGHTYITGGASPVLVIGFFFAMVAGVTGFIQT